LILESTNCPVKCVVVLEKQVVYFGLVSLLLIVVVKKSFALEESCLPFYTRSRLSTSPVRLFKPLNARHRLESKC